MGFREAVAAALLGLALAVFVTWASGINEALGTGPREAAAVIPWWVYAAVATFVVVGLAVEQYLG